MRTLVAPKGTSVTSSVAPHWEAALLQSTGECGGCAVTFELCQKPQLPTRRAVAVMVDG